MAGLPPKPVSSPPPPAKDDEDRRCHPDERYSRHLSQDDRSYRPRPMDSYIASYDDDRYPDRHRDRDWDRRTWDRAPRGREDDRDRMGPRYDRRRDDTYIAYDDRRHRRPPSPRRPDRYRSRSPRSRRPHSPPRRSRHSRSPPPLRRPRYNGQSPRSPHSPRPRRSRSRSRTPERRRRNHSRESVNDRHKDQGNSRYPIPAASPCRRRLSRSRSQSRSARKAPENGSSTAPSLKPAEQKTLETSATPNGPSQETTDRASRPKDTSSGDKLEQKSSLTMAQRSPRHSEKNHEPQSSPKRELQDGDVRIRVRSSSPPRQPRRMGNQSTRDGLPASKSPPRGPRNISKLSSALGATLPSHSSGLHGGRRPAPPATSYPRTGHGPHETSIETHTKKNNRALITAPLDAEIARLESHRANLAAEYVQLAKNTKRAHHELDMATLDLHAAEARRKVADSHLEKARAGTLGIPIDSPVS